MSQITSHLTRRHLYFMKVFYDDSVLDSMWTIFSEQLQTKATFKNELSQIA